MTKRAPDWWLSAWDEYGESMDTDRIVQVTVGILAPESDPAVAISLAGETPVKLSYQAVGRLQESLGWAVEEHRGLVLRKDRAGEGGEAAGEDAAVLSRERWQAVVTALQSSPGPHDEALEALKASAPPEWLSDLE